MMFFEMLGDPNIITATGLPGRAYFALIIIWVEGALIGLMIGYIFGRSKEYWNKRKINGGGRSKWM